MANALSDKRMSCGFTQMELAKRANISLGSLSNYENDKRYPRIDVALRLAHVLECDIWEIFPYNDIVEQLVWEGESVYRQAVSVTYPDMNELINELNTFFKRASDGERVRIFREVASLFFKEQTAIQEAISECERYGDDDTLGYNTLDPKDYAKLLQEANEEAKKTLMP